MTRIMHWHTENGLPDCIPNSEQIVATRQAAVDWITEECNLAEENEQPVKWYTNGRHAALVQIGTEMFNWWLCGDPACLA
jgi:hypothetical protein